MVQIHLVPPKGDLMLKIIGILALIWGLPALTTFAYLNIDAGAESNMLVSGIRTGAFILVSVLWPIFLAAKVYDYFTD